jgi:hypothetical protein
VGGDLGVTVGGGEASFLLGLKPELGSFTVYKSDNAPSDTGNRRANFKE